MTNSILSGWGDALGTCYGFGRFPEKELRKGDSFAGDLLKNILGNSNCQKARGSELAWGKAQLGCGLHRDLTQAQEAPQGSFPVEVRDVSGHRCGQSRGCWHQL